LSRDVDHINHVKSDNKWDNLRKVTATENKRNSPHCRNNTSGLMGISWRNDSKRWRARINVEGKCIDLGSFVNFHEAVNSRKNAEVFYGFHINHGK